MITDQLSASTERSASVTLIQQEMSSIADALNVPFQEVRRAMEAVGFDRKKIQAFLKEHGNRG
jgi:hypothetical protein